MASFSFQSVPERFVQGRNVVGASVTTYGLKEPATLTVCLYDGNGNKVDCDSRTYQPDDSAHLTAFEIYVYTSYVGPGKLVGVYKTQSGQVIETHSVDVAIGESAPAPKPTVSISVEKTTITTAEPLRVRISSSVAPMFIDISVDGKSYWAKQVSEKSVEAVVWGIPEGQHQVKVFVEAGGQMFSRTFTVQVVPAIKKGSFDVEVPQTVNAGEEFEVRVLLDNPNSFNVSFNVQVSLFGRTTGWGGTVEPGKKIVTFKFTAPDKPGTYTGSVNVKQLM